MMTTWLFGTLFLGTVTCSPLDDYVNAIDPNYKWVDTGLRLDFIEATAYVLNLTSQAWPTPDTNNRPIWWHYLVIMVPTTWVKSGNAFLYITGGDNTDSPPTIESEDLLVVARVTIGTSTLGACLFQVPNQPIYFDDDPSHQRRSEDAAIAWTWYTFIGNSSDPVRLLRFPMVKSAVKAMDAISEFSKTRLDVSTEKFAVAGASKRGWVTWLVGVVRPDKVACIMPLVLDVLHLHPVLHHQYRSYGGWTWAFSDYYALNLTADIDTANFQDLITQIDPFSFRTRLTMPKFIVVSSDDEFMMLDDPSFWWNDLPGEKHILVAQNSEHSLITAIVEVINSLMNFANSVFHNGTRPQYQWVVDDDAGYITVNISASTPPVRGGVVLRYADTLSTTMRDFRWIVRPPECKFPNIKIDNLCVQPILWQYQVLTPVPGTTYLFRVNLKAPDLGGWRAYYVDMEFPSDTGLSVNYRITTRASIQSVNYPFLDCQGAECLGKLV